MAEIKDGILGGVYGKVGTVIGVTWRGRHFLRSLPNKSATPASEKQLIQRGKMKLISPFTSKIKDFVNKHYQPLQKDSKILNGQEQLTSFLLQNGIEIIQGEPHLAVEKVFVSLGALPSATIKKISVLKDGKIKVLWDDTILNALTQPHDQLTIVAYNDATNTFYIAENIAQRKEKYIHFELDKKWVTGNIHLWTLWKSVDYSMNSTSIYHSPLVLNKEIDHTALENLEE